MPDFIEIVDALRRRVEDDTCRVQVTKITVLTDGDYRVDGYLVRRKTMFYRTWVINRSNLSVLEL